MSNSSHKLKTYVFSLTGHINQGEWECLKELLKDYPEPTTENNNVDFLEQYHVIGLIEIFDRVFGLDNIDYELRMYGVPEDIERDLIETVFNDFRKFVQIVGSSNGVSVLLCHWLENAELDRKAIERSFTLKQLDV